MIKNNLVILLFTISLASSMIFGFVLVMDYLYKIIEETGLSKYIMKLTSVRDYYHVNIKRNIVVMMIQLLIAFMGLGSAILLEKYLLSTTGVLRLSWRVYGWLVSFGIVIVVIGGINARLLISLLTLAIIDFCVYIYFRRLCNRAEIPGAPS